jgi:hypothetical protein
MKTGILTIGAVMKQKNGEKTRKPVIYIGPPEKCDLCQRAIGAEFYDGKTVLGPWANMCERCWHVHSFGLLGLGKGQKYRRNAAGEYEKVAG